MKKAIKHSPGTILLLLTLWSVLVLVDRVIIGANYFYTVHDLETGWFGWMLNWLSGEPRLVWYTPAVSPRMLNGLISLVIDVDFSEKSITDFVWIGIAVQAFFVVICAIWYSWITEILRIGWLEKVFLIVLFFCFPTMLMYLGHRGFYFEFWLLGLPLGLTLYAALNRRSEVHAAAGAGCGFLAANYYPSVLVIVVFMCVLVGQRLFDNEKRLFKEYRNKSVFPENRLGFIPVFRKK